MNSVASENLPLADVRDDDLARINYRRFLPHPLLRPWVQCYWSAKIINVPAKPFIERQYSDGGVSITLNLKDPHLHQISAQQSLDTLVVDRAFDIVGIRFHPGGAQWLLRESMSDLVSHRYSTNDFTLSNMSSLTESLSESPVTSIRFALIDRWLLEQWQRWQPKINAVQKFLFSSLAGEIDLGTWCAQQCVSRRTMERSFKRYAGISPNQLKSLQQVRRARYLIKEDPAQPLALIAQASGYYDQAHFTHQFRKITEQTPGQYQRRQLSKRSAV